MKAMILAAGLGTRLRPLTDKIPKVMVPINGRPLLEYHIKQLKEIGINEFAINLHHLPHVITNHFGDGSKFGVSITYSFETKLRGTAGAVKKVEDFFGGSFMVVYGDNLVNADLSELIRFHQSCDSLVTIAAYRHHEPWTMGSIELAENGEVVGFIEKPDKDKVNSDLVNAGIYVLEPKVLPLIPENAFCDFGADLFPLMLRRELPLRALELMGYVQDVGTTERYAKALSDVKMGKVIFDTGQR